MSETVDCDCGTKDLLKTNSKFQICTLSPYNKSQALETQYY